MTDPVPLAPAAPPPPLRPGDVPLAILVDYDGTIAQTDVSDTIMAAAVPGLAAIWEERTAEYDAGLVGSRGLMEWEVALIERPAAELRALAAAQPHDAGFAPMVRRAREAGIPVEVVSDGFGFFIPAALESLGVGDVPVVSADTSFPSDGPPRIAFPNGHPACRVCGTCKRNRVLAYQASGRAVVFIGDGESDRYAAGYSDVVFAKHALVRLCLDNGWPFRRWTDFDEIDAWLAETIGAFRADTPSAAAADRRVPRPVAKPFFCGPEVWGPGRTDPPRGAP